MCIVSKMIANHLILGCCLLLPPSIFPSIRVFQMSWVFPSGGQSIGASGSASVLPMSIQGWFPLGLIGLISLLSKGLSIVFFSPQFESINSSVLSLLYSPTLTSIHEYWKNHSFDYMDLSRQSDGSAFNTLSRLRSSSVQSLNRVWLFLASACQASPSITKLMSIESVIVSNHLILCHLLLLLPAIFPNIRVFSNESALNVRWPKYWSFSFIISPYNEHSGLISFRMDWLDLLAAQGTLKSLLQHHSSKSSILWCSVFFMVQLSHPYMTTGKTIALTRWTFVGKVMSQLFNMLSRLVIIFLPRSKRLLISWLQSPSAWF